jgi:hypothetical protein
MRFLKLRYGGSIGGTPFLSINGRHRQCSTFSCGKLHPLRDALLRPLFDRELYVRDERD